MKSRIHRGIAKLRVRNSKLSFAFCSSILRAGLALALALVTFFLLLPASVAAVTLSLNLNGDVTVNLVPSKAGTHYTLLNDSKDNTYVRSNGNSYLSDLYNLGNPDITGKGVIDNIEIHYRAYGDQITQPSTYTILTLGANSLDTSATTRTLTTSVTEYTDTYSSRPGGGTWTWLDITSLRAGVALRDSNPTGNKRSYCTKFWVVVNYTAVTLESYRDAAHTIVWGTSSTQYNSTYKVVYMYGINWVPNHTYHIAYYDGKKAKVLSDGMTSGSDNTLTHSYDLSSSSSKPGTWHAVVFDDDIGSPPAKYSSGATGSVADDTFVVAASAIPEFPTVMAGIVVAGACFGIYWWMRKRKIQESVFRIH